MSLLASRILPELKIVSYIAFIIFLFLIQDLTVYIFILIAISVLLLQIPFTSLKRGWIPIGFFLAFTFISNMFFSHGKIICNLGSVVITEEGIHIATVRTLRIFFMVAGAKILTATTPLEILVGALGKTLNPLERIGLPVEEFFSVMGLTLKCFPRLKDHLSENYRSHIGREGHAGFLKKARIISSFLLPMFIQSMQSPEGFFKERSADNNHEVR